MDQPRAIDSELFQGATDWDWQAKRLLKEQFGQLPVAVLRLEVSKETELLHIIGDTLLKIHQEARNILKKLQLAH